MTADDAIGQVLTDYWDEIWPRLDGEQQAELANLLRELAVRTDFTDAGRLLARITGIVRQALAPGHPGRVALGPEVQHPAGDQPSARELAGRMRTLYARTVRDRVRARLLQVAALSPGQVRARGEDPDRRFLIRLDPGSGEQLLPGFQFDPAGRARAVVLDINQRLQADHNPWGAADWWLSRNPWLNAAPADLIGVHDHLVRAAADAIGRGER